MSPQDEADAIIQAGCLQVSGQLIEASGRHEGIDVFNAPRLTKLAAELYVAWRNQRLPNESIVSDRRARSA